MREYSKSFMVAVIMAVAFALTLGGCGKPTDEMLKAEEAIDAAKALDNYKDCSKSDIDKAERLLNEGKAMIKFACKYEKAKEKFEEAYAIAVKAKGKVCRTKQKKVKVKVNKPVDNRVRSHTVVRGECLWWISEYDQIYGDPFQWPLIYDANRSEIDSTAHRYGHWRNEEDWIYPGQVFSIPRDMSLDEIKDARRRAGAPAPYMPPGK